MLKKINPLVLLVYAIVSVMVFQDYGLNIDESIERKHGVVTYNYILNKFGLDSEVKNTNLYDLNHYDHKDYGSIFQVVSYVVELNLNFKSTKQIFLLRHALVMLLFILALYQFQWCIFLLFQNYLYVILGVILIITCPRIFADSFYNSKDIVFLSLMIFCITSFIKNQFSQSYKSIAIHSLTTGLLISTRILGVYIFILTIIIIIMPSKINFQLSRHRVISTGKMVILYMLLTTCSSLLFWPSLWQNPVTNFLQAFENMKQFRWYGQVFYMNEFIEANSLPWHYPLIWIGITIPVFYLVWCIIGTSFIIIQTLLYRSINKNRLFLIMALVIPIASTIILNSTLYNGWRHLYFVTPFLIILALYGIRYLIGIINLHKGKIILKALAIGLVLSGVLEITSTIYFMVKYHPYQFAYFNAIGQNQIGSFETDYYGLTYKDALGYILEVEKKAEKIEICSPHLAGQINRFYFNEREYSKIVYTDLQSSKYFITNPFVSSLDYAKYKNKEFPYNRPKIFSVNVLNSELVIVYKLK